MSFSKRPGNDAVCYTKTLDSLKCWNDHFIWVDAFACPASFPWHTSKSVSKNRVPKSSEFNAEYYASLVAYPALFQSDFASYSDSHPTKVRVGERMLMEGRTKLLDASVGLVVPCYLIGQLVGEGDPPSENFWPSFKVRYFLRLSYHSGANVAKAEVDSIVMSSALVMTNATTVIATVDATTVLKETSAKPSLFAAGSSSTGGTEPILGGFSDLTGNDFLVSGIRTVIDPDYDLQKVYVSQWNMTNGSHLDDGGVCREMIDEFAPLNFFASIREIEHDQVFTKFNVGAARQMSLSAEVRMRAKYNIKEKRKLKSVVDEQTEVLKAREKEIEDLRAQLLLKEAKAAKAIRLRAEVSQCKVVKKSLRDDIQALTGHNTTLENEKSELDVKVTNLAASIKVREQEVADLDDQVTAVKLQSDNLANRVHELDTSSAGLQEKVMVYEDCMSQLEKFQDERMRVVNDKFDKLYTDFVEMALHLEEKFYPHLLTTIAGRRWLLTYGMKLAIVKCLHSPEYLSALGVAISKAIEKRKMELQDVNISLLAELKSNKDASVETLMGILRLEETLDERLVQKIRDNIANHRSALRDVFVLLVESLSSVALEETKGTSDAAPDTTTALSTTYASASSIPPILTDDYVVVHVGSQECTSADVNPFLNVDDAELNIS
ncbi:hypothetical protein Tco_0469192 [Tanacetum coccineum]